MNVLDGRETTLPQEVVDKIQAMAEFIRKNTNEVGRSMDIWTAEDQSWWV